MSDHSVTSYNCTAPNCTNWREVPNALDAGLKKALLDGWSGVPYLCPDCNPNATNTHRPIPPSEAAD